MQMQQKGDAKYVVFCLPTWMPPKPCSVANKQQQKLRAQSAVRQLFKDPAPGNGPARCCQGWRPADWLHSIMRARRNERESRQGPASQPHNPLCADPQRTTWQIVGFCLCYTAQQGR